MSFSDLIVLCILSAVHLGTIDSQLTIDGHVKNYLPPPKEHLIQDRHCVNGSRYVNVPSFNCHGATFIVSNGYFQPCNRHSHCYQSREPTDWCVMAPNFRWTNWGCHCDRKLSSCVIERYDYKNRELQWSYCTPKNEFYCASHFDSFHG